MTAPEYPSASVIRRQAAEREVRDKYGAARIKLAAEMQRELDDIERRFWRGEFNEA